MVKKAALEQSPFLLFYFFSTFFQEFLSYDPYDITTDDDITNDSVMKKNYLLTVYRNYS